MPTLDRDTDTPAKGVFADIEAASRAVRELSENSVPADSIRVLLMDERGDVMRELSVEDEAGALRGALIGGAIGAAIGVVVVIVTTAIEFNAGATLGVHSLTGALAAIAATTAACVPLGALWGTGWWRGRTKLSTRDRTADSVTVLVESDELSAVASRVLSDGEAAVANS